MLIIIYWHVILIPFSLAAPRSLLPVRVPLILQDMHFQVRAFRFLTLLHVTFGLHSSRLLQPNSSWHLVQHQPGIHLLPDAVSFPCFEYHPHILAVLIKGGMFRK